MYDEVIDAILQMVKLYTSYTVVLGSNPTKESIAITGTGAPTTIYKNKDTEQELVLTVNGKSGHQQNLLHDLTEIQRKLFLRSDYPQGNNWHIYSIEPVASPRLIAVEQNNKNQWIYGSSIKVKFYQLGLKGEI